MQKIGLFYASSTGNTEDAAKEIKDKFQDVEISLHNIADATDNEMQNYTHLILGVSTWGEGDLQDDWEEYIDNLNSENLNNKTVALFGLGDQEEYCDNYLDAMGTIYDKVVDSGATVVGSWPSDEYEHDDSKAIRDGEFVGLALDADNQDDMTTERIEAWIELIKPYFIK